MIDNQDLLKKYKNEKLIKSILSKIEELEKQIQPKISDIEELKKVAKTLNNSSIVETQINQIEEDLKPLQKELEQQNKELETALTKLEKENQKIFSLEKIIKKLENEYKFVDNYLFLDLEIGKYVLLNNKEKTITHDDDGNEITTQQKSISFIDKGNIEDALKSQIKILQQKGIIDKNIDRFNSTTIQTIKKNISGMFQIFDRFEEQIFIRKNIPTLNKFIPTQLIQYKPKKRITYQELRTTLKQYPYFEILLKNNINNNEEYLEYLLNWLSAEMNTPQKVHTSIIFIGDQGSGKSQLIETIFKENLYDQSNVVVMNNNTWFDKFNSVFEDKTFVINNEVSLAGNTKSLNLAEEIKRLITDDSIMIRGIQKASVEKKITFSMVFLTNNDTPLIIEKNDRRFTVFGRSKPLLVNEDLQNLLKKEQIDMEQYIVRMKEEAKEFLYHVKSLKFDKKVFTTPLHTVMKEQIISNTTINQVPVSTNNQTTQKINTVSDEVQKLLQELKNLIISQNFYKFEEFLEKINYDNDEKTKLLQMFRVGIFTNPILSSIYKTIVIDGTNEASGRFFNNFLIPLDKKIKVNKIEYNVKLVDVENIEEKREDLIKILKNEYEDFFDITDDEIPF